MPVFTINIFKMNGSAGNTHWANVYHVVAPNMDEARAAGLTLVTAEKEVHSTDVYFTFYRTSTTPPDGLVFTNTPINSAGDRSIDGDRLPLFLALRMDFTAVLGRGGRKFFHLLPGENDQDAGVWSLTLTANVANAFDDAIDALSAASTPLTNEGGTTTYNNITVFDAVTQHQFRRSSKRPPV